MDVTRETVPIPAVHTETAQAPRHGRHRKPRSRGAGKLSTILAFGLIAIVTGAGTAAAVTTSSGGSSLADVAASATASLPAVHSVPVRDHPMWTPAATPVKAASSPAVVHATTPVTPAAPTLQAAARPVTITPKATPSATATPVATAAAVTVSGSDDARLLAEAEREQGVPYAYGGASPGGFDCSGLIYWSANQLGIKGMPRDTYSMLGQGVSSGLLVAVSHPEPGDLAFFGSGHVELYIKSGETFGAQKPGTSVGFHTYGYGYVPTAFYRVR